MTIAQAATPQLESRQFVTNPSLGQYKDSAHINSLPVNLSFLNAGEKPAGKRGFVRARGESLVFADGSPARFWGTNITARAIFQTSKINICKQAQSLSAIGFNLARIHHHDSSWVNPNIFGRKGYRHTRSLDEKSVEKIDWWIKCLKQEGIYIWLDLHVGRQLQLNDDIFAFSETLRGDPKIRSSLKGYNYVNASIVDAMKAFNRSYLTHINSYTGLAYKDDPAIVAMLITNENDITNHFANRLLPAKKAVRHSAIYMREAKAFAENNQLPVNSVWRSWEAGASKLFLNDLEHRFNQEMIQHLKDIGVKVPIATTNSWGTNPLSSLPSLTDGDIIDVHAYGGLRELEQNPLFTADMTSWMSAGQVAGMPMTVSEWNLIEFPVEDRHTAPLIIAGRANHQGWDAMMHYAHSKDSLDKTGRPSNWNAFNDPAFIATLPAAALLYRQQHVRAAETSYLLKPGLSMFERELSAETSRAIRLLSKIGKLQIALPEVKPLPWLNASAEPDEAIVIEDMDFSPVKPESGFIVTDTGEIRHDWKRGVLQINTDKSQIVSGWIGSRQLQLQDTRFNLKTPNATVAVQSLDGSPITTARRILITLAALSSPYKNLQGRLSLPFYSQKLQGNLGVKARQGMKLYALNNNAAATEIEAIYNQGSYQINLDDISFTHWLMLSSEQAAD